MVGRPKAPEPSKMVSFRMPLSMYERAKKKAGGKGLSQHLLSLVRADLRGEEELDPERTAKGQGYWRVTPQEGESADGNLSWKIAGDDDPS